MSLILVTGAAGNLGQAIATKFIDEGHRVIGTVRSESSSNSANLILRKVDLGNEESVKGFDEALTKEHGIPDVAIFTAGGFAKGDLKSTTAQQLAQQYELNFITTFILASKVFEQMKQRGSGKIFFTAAAAALHMADGVSKVAYVLSKSLLFRLAELMNADKQESEVEVSVMAPEIIDTPQNRGAMPDADFNKWTSPETIASLVYQRSMASAPADSIILLPSA